MRKPSRQEPVVADTAQLLAWAEQCVREPDAPVYEFALALARARGVSVGRVLFGDAKHDKDVRLLLKQAEYRALY
ncbi:MAG: hypothetical protein AB7G23_12585 [Vicinamibacterales bacterium]